MEPLVRATGELLLHLGSTAEDSAQQAAALAAAAVREMTQVATPQTNKALLEGVYFRVPVAEVRWGVEAAE